MMKTTLTAGLLLAIAAAPIVAQEMGGPGGPDEDSRPMFEQFDADGDGSVTMEEVEAQRGARFAETDTNGDGAVSLEEFTARAAARATERATAMFERLDADGDGSLSRDVLELHGPRGHMGERMFSGLDADEDGAVSEDEFDAARDRMAGMHGYRGHGGDRHHGGHGSDRH
jgi:hypothetical protein